MVEVEGREKQKVGKKVEGQVSLSFGMAFTNHDTTINSKCFMTTRTLPLHCCQVPTHYPNINSMSHDDIYTRKEKASQHAMPWTNQLRKHVAAYGLLGVKEEKIEYFSKILLKFQLKLIVKISVSKQINFVKISKLLRKY